MDVRLRTEEIEHLTLAPWASFSDRSRGRARPEPQDPLRPVLPAGPGTDHPLQGVPAAEAKDPGLSLAGGGDLYRTRLTHTLEVSQIARTIARALRLNEDLTEAVALAHDLGHTPFGHAGERALNALCPGGFKHYEQSLRVVDRLEKDGRGLNLTWEVRNGIVTHTKGTWAATPEGRIVRMADQIAYVNHDIEDAVRGRRAGPPAAAERGHRRAGADQVGADHRHDRQHPGPHRAPRDPGRPVEDEAFRVLKAFMYSTVYVDKVGKHEEQKVDKVIEALYEHYMGHTEQMSPSTSRIAEGGRGRPCRHRLHQRDERRVCHPRL